MNKAWNDIARALLGQIQHQLIDQVQVLDRIMHILEDTRSKQNIVGTKTMKQNALIKKKLP